MAREIKMWSEFWWEVRLHVIRMETRTGLIAIWTSGADISCGFLVIMECLAVRSGAMDLLFLPWRPPLKSVVLGIWSA